MPSIGGQKSDPGGPVFGKNSPVSDGIGYHFFGFCGRRVVGKLGNGKAFISGLEGRYDSGRQAGPFTTQTSYFTKPAEKYTPYCLFNSLLSFAYASGSLRIKIKRCNHSPYCIICPSLTLPAR